MAEGFGDLRAVTNLEDSAEALRESEKPSGSWMSRNSASGTPEGWKM